MKKYIVILLLLLAGVVEAGVPQPWIIKLSRLAQTAASTGQVIKWNGSAWAPADDITAGELSDSSIYIILTGRSGHPHPIAYWLDDTTFMIMDSLYKDSFLIRDTGGVMTLSIDGKIITPQFLDSVRNGDFGASGPFADTASYLTTHSGADTPLVAFRGDTLAYEKGADTAIFAIHGDSGAAILFMRQDSVLGYINYNHKGAGPYQGHKFNDGFVMFRPDGDGTIGYVLIDTAGYTCVSELWAANLVLSPKYGDSGKGGAGDGVMEFIDSALFSYDTEFDDTVRFDAIVIANDTFVLGGVKMTTDSVAKALNDASGNVITTTYEVQLNDEAGLYAVLSDVSDFVQPSEVPGLETDANHDDFSELSGSIDTTQVNDTQFEEYIEDNTGAMFTGNTETRITVTYNEDGTTDFVVDDIDALHDNLTEFTEQTADQIFYSDGSGDVQEVTLGASGTYLKSQGTGSAPTWGTPTGTAVWDEGDSLVTYQVDDSVIVIRADSGKAIIESEKDTIRIGSDETIIINGGSDETVIANDTIYLGDASDDDFVALHFAGLNDSGGIRYNTTTDKMQASHDLSTWNDIGTGGGEANTIGDTGVFNETDGFGLAGGKNGTELYVKGLIEGTNITLSKSEDSAIIITASGGSGDVTDVDGGIGLSDDGETGTITLHAVWSYGLDTVHTGGDTALQVDTATGGVADAEPLPVTGNQIYDWGVATFLQLTGGTMTGYINLGTDSIIGGTRIATDTIDISGDVIGDLNGYGLAVTGNTLELDTADAVADAETKPVTGNAVYDYAIANLLFLTGGTMTGFIDMGTDSIIGLTRVDPDTIDISGDIIGDFNGYGLTVTSNVLEVDTADAVADAEPKPVTGNAVYDWVTAQSYLTAEINDLEANDPPNVADSEIYIGTGTGTGEWANVSGDVTMSNAGVVTIAPNAVESSMIAPNSIDSSELKNEAVAFANINNNYNIATNPQFEISETFFGGIGIIFEGSTKDDIEGLLTCSDPTVADRTWALPNWVGTSPAYIFIDTGATQGLLVDNGTSGLTVKRSLAVTSGGAASNYDFTWTNPAGLAGNPWIAHTRSAASGDIAMTANMATFSANGIAFEGTTDDAFEGLLRSSIATSDKTWVLPNQSDTIALLTSVRISPDTIRPQQEIVFQGGADDDTLKDLDSGPYIMDSLGTLYIKDGSIVDSKIDSMDYEKIESGTATDGQVLTYDGTNWGPDEVTINSDDINFVGDFPVYGHIAEIDKGVWIDINRAWVEEAPDTVVPFNTFLSECNDDGPGKCALHPKLIELSSGGLWGYDEAMFFSPIICSTGGCDASVENITFNVRRLDGAWHTPIDSFSGSPSYDSVASALLTIDSVDSDVDYLLDPSGFIDENGIPWGVTGVNDATGGDTMRVLLIKGDKSDITSWSHRKGSLTDNQMYRYAEDDLVQGPNGSGSDQDSLFYVAEFIPASGAQDIKYVSPQIEMLETGKYGLWINQVREDAAWVEENPPDYGDTCYLLYFESQYPCSAYTFVDTVRNAEDSSAYFLYTSASDSASVWHFSWIPIAPNVLQFIAYYMPWTDNGSPNLHPIEYSGGIKIGISYDGGRTIQMKDDWLMQRESDTSCFAAYLYQATGSIDQGGEGWTTDLYVSGKDSSTLEWEIGRVRVHYEDRRVDTTDTNFTAYVNSLDSTNITDGGLSEDDMNWQWDVAPFQLPALGRSVTPTDSVTLRLPHYDNGIVLVADSTNQGSDVDSFWITTTIPCLADTLDSLIFCYKGDGGANIDSLVIFGPDRSNGTNVADSQYWSANVDLTASSWTRVAYFVSDSLKPANFQLGDNWALKIRMDLTTDDDWVRISWAQLRYKR